MIMIDSLLRSLCLDEASGEVDEDEFSKSLFGRVNSTFPLTIFGFFKGPSDVVMIDSLLRSLCLDEASEEVDEDDAEGEGEDVHDEEGEGPPVQAGHLTT